MAAEGLAQVSDGGELEEACRKVIAANPDEAARFNAGNTKLMGFFVGRRHEGDRRQGQPEGRQRDPAGACSGDRVRCRNVDRYVGTVDIDLVISKLRRSFGGHSQMYAVIASGGKQYRVSEGETLRVEKLEGAAGTKLSFGPLLFSDDGGGVQSKAELN